MALSYNDGQLSIGTYILALSSSVGVGKGTYIAENVDHTLATTAVVRNNEVGEYSSGAWIPEQETGTATLQLATTSSLLPARGDVFNISWWSGSASQKYTVTQVGLPTAQREAKKANISFSQVNT
jgi:hypothetical protein